MAAVVGQLAESMGRLLVVEGDLVQRTVIGRIGANLGYDTAFASSFEAAAGLLRHESFDVMTIDLSLGTRDGIELLRLAADLGLHTIRLLTNHPRKIVGLDAYGIQITEQVPV